MTDRSLSNSSGFVSLTAELILPHQAELIKFKPKSTDIVITFVFFLLIARQENGISVASYCSRSCMACVAAPYFFFVITYLVNGTI